MPRTDTGKLGSLQSSWTEWRGYRFLIEIVGSKGMIRTSYMATHTFDELDKVADVFARLGRDSGLLRFA